MPNTYSTYAQKSQMPKSANVINNPWRCTFSTTWICSVSKEFWFTECWRQYRLGTDSGCGLHRWGFWGKTLLCALRFQITLILIRSIPILGLRISLVSSTLLTTSGVGTLAGASAYVMPASAETLLGANSILVDDEKIVCIGSDASTRAASKAFYDFIHRNKNLVSLRHSKTMFAIMSFVVRYNR